MTHHKYLLHLAYQGTSYHGWQRQPNHPSVQQTLEEALEKMLRHPVTVIGCGRTDTGVHASQYFAHIALPYPLEVDFDPILRLGQILPDDIAVFEIQPVPGDFHAQHDASSRSYTYQLQLRKNPFRKNLSAYYLQGDLDLKKMQAATTLLSTITEFRAMCKQPDLYKHTRCRLSTARLSVAENGHCCQFDFTADRFLRNMVRLMVGNIISVGQGRLDLKKFAHHLRSGERPEHFVLAWPEGLYLSKVQYARLPKMPLTER